jgi:hypothetical protein
MRRLVILTSPVVLITILLGLPGCGWKQDAENWRRTAEDYKAQLETANQALDQTRKDLKEHSEQWQARSTELGKAMVDASTTLDPLAIKTIYQDNRDLTAIIQKLNAETASALPQAGILLLADAQLRLDVVDIKGRSVIRAFLDEDNHPFLAYELAATEPALPVPDTIASELYDDIFRTSKARNYIDTFATQEAEHSFAARRGEIDRRYRDAVKEAFSNYLKDGRFETPQGVPRPIFLARQFRTPGRHEIRIQVEPKTPVWQVRIIATEVSRDKAEKVVKDWQLNPRTTPNPRIIPRMMFWIRHRPDDQKPTNAAAESSPHAMSHSSLTKRD